MLMLALVGARLSDLSSGALRPAAVTPGPACYTPEGVRAAGRSLTRPDRKLCWLTLPYPGKACSPRYGPLYPGLLCGQR